MSGAHRARSCPRPGRSAASRPRSSPARSWRRSLHRCCRHRATAGAWGSICHGPRPLTERPFGSSGPNYTPRSAVTERTQTSVSMLEDGGRERQPRAGAALHLWPDGHDRVRARRRPAESTRGPSSLRGSGLAAAERIAGRISRTGEEVQHAEQVGQVTEEVDKELECRHGLLPSMERHRSCDDSRRHAIQLLPAFDSCAA